LTESWDQYAEDWDINKDVIAYSEKAYAALDKLINLDGLRVLDFGCGTGLLTEKIAQKADSVLGLDSSEKMVTVLKNKRLNKVSVLAVELSRKEIESNSAFQSKFDLIVASSVCAFLPNYGEVLLLLKSALKLDGVFVQWDWVQTAQEPDFGFTEEMILKSYNKVGLEVVKIESAFSIQSSEGVMPVIMGVGRNI